MLPASPIYGMHTFLTWLRLLIKPGRGMGFPLGPPGL